MSASCIGRAGDFRSTKIVIEFLLAAETIHIEVGETGLGPICQQANQCPINIVTAKARITKRSQRGESHFVFNSLNLYKRTVKRAATEIKNKQPFGAALNHIVHFFLAQIIECSSVCLIDDNTVLRR